MYVVDGCRGVGVYVVYVMYVVDGCRGVKFYAPTYPRPYFVRTFRLLPPEGAALHVVTLLICVADGDGFAGIGAVAHDGFKHAVF